jgi:hypothetical protein
MGFDSPQRRGDAEKTMEMPTLPIQARDPWPFPRTRSIVGRELPLEARYEIAAFLEAAGARARWSTGIDGYLTRGYGSLDEWGFWQYPLPTE